MTDTAVRAPLTLAELRDAQKTLFISNLTATVITCTVGAVNFQLAPQGKPGSIDFLPKEIAGSPSLHKLYLKRLVEITDDPSMEEKISGLVLSQAEASAQRTADILDSVETNSASKDLIPKECLVSGETIFQTVAQVKEGVPPLAIRFADQAHLWIPTQVLGKNGPEFKFNKIGV